MSATPVRRSTRLASATPSVAASRVASVVPATASKRKGPLPKLKVNQSSAYGASGLFNAAANDIQFSTTGFEAAFDRKRNEALERDNSASRSATPLRPTSSSNIRVQTPSSDAGSERSSGLEASKSFGQVHEAGMLNQEPAVTIRKTLPATPIRTQPSPLRVLLRMLRRNWLGILNFLLILLCVGAYIYTTKFQTKPYENLPVQPELQEVSDLMDQKIALALEDLNDTRKWVESRMWERTERRLKDYFQGEFSSFKKAQLDTAPVTAATSFPKFVNFFSPALAARIDPKYTSPSSSKHLTLMGRIYNSVFFIPSMRPPISALQSWNEAGDCWCTAQGKPKGWAQLAVNLGQAIFPTQVIIDHIPKQSTLDPLSAPKDLELWVDVPVYEQWLDVVQKSKNFLQHECTEPDEKGSSWVCIGRFQYNIHAANHIQTFGVMDMEGVPIRSAMIRAVSNWGRSWTCFYRILLAGRMAEEFEESG